jgi:23S rRNA pseudouridine1911/1915/1917 synthase
LTDRLTVEAADAGERLDRWLASRLPAQSRARLQALVASGHVRVDGVKSRASFRLKTGQLVEVEIPAPVPAEPQPEAIALVVVYEDPQLMVIEKPAGLVVHPGAGNASGTLVNALLHHARDLSGIGGVLRPGIVHRLDRGTSGLMVVAKDDATHQELARQFAARSVSKEYLAVVLGVPTRKSGAIEGLIGRDPSHRKKMAVGVPRGRQARSSYEVLEALDAAALLRVRIQTGRTHQIRVHLASLGHPVAGDRTYGGKRTPGCRRPEARAALESLARPALHAARLAFVHPSSGERLSFTSPLPPDLRALVAILGGTR